MSTRKGVCLLILLIFLSSVAVVEGPVGPDPYIPGNGGGGSSKLTLNKFTRYLENWEDEKGFDHMKELLWKEPWTNKAYIQPAVLLYCSYPNDTISRGDELKIGANIWDNNPIDIRRVVHLYLEVQDPGENEFRTVASQKIQVNEYGRENNTIRIFPEIGSFDYLNGVGEVKLRVRATDGVSMWNSTRWEDDSKNGNYGERTLIVYNNPPTINNTTMSVEPDLAQWDEYITYTFDLADKDQDEVNVTLLVYKNDSAEKSGEESFDNITADNCTANENTSFCISRTFPAKREMSPFSFVVKGSEIFGKEDAGKNFTYRFSCNDSMNTTLSETGYGPQLKEITKITVEPNNVSAEDDNYYWWNSYSFGLKVRSLNPEGEDVTVTLFTEVDNCSAKQCGKSLTRHVTRGNATTFSFKDVKPFDITDRNKTFCYYFTYDVPDQEGDYKTEFIPGNRAVNPKALEHPMFSSVTIFNLVLIGLISLLGGVLMERTFFRRW